MGRLRGRLRAFVEASHTVMQMVLLGFFLVSWILFVFGRHDVQAAGMAQMCFPLNGYVRKRLCNQCRDVGYLATIVTAEIFLLRLCLKVWGAGEVKTELPKELKIWAVSSVTVFRNSIFFEILLKLLLGPTLPFKSLLNSKEENLVKSILYDAVIFMDYSFLNPGMESEQSFDRVKSLALIRLFVSDKAKCSHYT